MEKLKNRDTLIVDLHKILYGRVSSKTLKEDLKAFSGLGDLSEVRKGSYPTSTYGKEIRIGEHHETYTLPIRPTF